MSGVGAERTLREAPTKPAPGAALGPPKLGGRQEAAHSLEAPLASLTFYTPLGRQTLVSDPPTQGPLRAFSEVGERRPGYEPRGTKIP